jgi:hypothetical protein
MEWISSLFLIGYGQRSRTTFFNTFTKNNFSPGSLVFVLKLISTFIGQNLKLFFVNVLKKDVLLLSP